MQRCIVLHVEIHSRSWKLFQLELPNLLFLIRIISARVLIICVQRGQTFHGIELQDSHDGYLVIQSPNNYYLHRQSTVHSSITKPLSLKYLEKTAPYLKSV